MSEKIHNTSKGICVVSRGRHKTKFVWNPKLRTWFPVGKSNVCLYRTGSGAWRVSAPTIGDGKVLIPGGPKARRKAFGLAATHAV